VVLDLSAVTDGLINLVKNAWTSAPIWTEIPSTGPFTLGVTGFAPDRLKDLSGPQLSIFLYHVESDNSQQSNFWAPQMVTSPGQPVHYLPLALNLFYLVSAYSEARYIDEQQAMSVALRLFHANAVVRSEPGVTPVWELRLTMEHRSYDELSRLWQATTAPIRLGVVYRASVLFLTPDEPGEAAGIPGELHIELGGTLAAVDPDLVVVTKQ
jgi:hypothetical protein